MDRTSLLSSKGQITIPLEIRKRLGLKAGDRVEFVIDGDRTFVRPARSAVGNPFSQFIGIGETGFDGVQEINNWVADMRDDDG